MDNIEKQKDDRIRVSKKDKCYEAFYFHDIDQKEVVRIVENGLAKILTCETDAYVGFPTPHLFVRVGEYKKNNCHGEDVHEEHKIQNVQIGNWILIEYEMEGDTAVVAKKAMVVSSNAMMKQYKSLMENTRITLEGVDIEPSLFEDDND